MFDNPVYRAIVHYSDSSTGLIRVRIPVLSGASSILDISYIGRTAYNGVWAVPEIGSQIVVTADDANFTNVFWVQVAPDPAISTSGLQDQITINTSNTATNTSDIATNTSGIAGIIVRLNELESYRDALLLGVFK